jgi:hypothetical protein
MNEFRAQLKDQASTFIPRVEYETHYDQVCDDVKDLRESRAELKGKADQSSVNIAYLIGFIGIIIAVLTFISDLITG